jgi:hypothetical protein
MEMSLARMGIKFRNSGQQLKVLSLGIGIAEIHVTGINELMI